MATQPLSDMDRRLKAGREYLLALRKLGFEPNAMLWAGVGGDPTSERMELLIVTSWADNIGPKAIYDLLFEAYDASATPKEVDPFSVTLFSPHTSVAKDLYDAMRTLKAQPNRKEIHPMIVLGMMDYFTTTDWIISFKKVSSTQFNDARRFMSFQHNVAKLAA